MQPFVAGLSMVQAAALNWVPSADAQSGSLQYQFRYSISPSIYETIVYAGASSTASFNLPAGRVTLIAYINNPGTVAAASPGDQPTGARWAGAPGHELAVYSQNLMLDLLHLYEGTQ